MTREGLDFDAVDLSMLAELLEQGDYGAGYLDPATGEVYPAFEGEVLGADGEPVDLDETDWMALGGEQSRDSYRDMQVFAEAVWDPTIRRRLLDALDGRGAFGRFRSVVHNTSERLGPTWNRFRDARSEIRAIEWLVDTGLVAQAAADNAIAARSEQADAVLEEVGARPRGAPSSGGVVDVRERLERFSDTWSPKTVARLNDYEIKLVKLEGEFVWHAHEETDELFFVIDGDLTIQLRDGDVHLGPGQMYVVPRGVEHCPVADGEVAAMLVEPAGVVNTGDAGGNLTASEDDTLLT
jgi:mannose-6-phosphate isomerase-like protein (cupin superfamily)